MKKKITFYYENPNEKNIFTPIAAIAKKKNFKVEFTNNLKKYSEIGFYCFGDKKKIKSKNSFIFLGGMDQARNNWPNIWEKQPWNNFDIGFLPGKDWSHRWKSSSWDYKSRPKKGVFESGWPKADIVCKRDQLQKKSKKLKKKYKIPKVGKNILYAPSQESNGKQLDVAKCIKESNFKLLVKHWVTKKSKYKDKWQVVQKENDETKKILGEKCIIIKPQENFIEILPLVDLLITDESSVAYEALLLDIPTISVSDWKMQRHSRSIARYVKPAKVCFVTDKKNLKKKINEFMKKKKFYKRKIKKMKTYHFSNVGFSSNIIIEILIMYLKNGKINQSPFFLKPQYELSNVKAISSKLKQNIKRIKFIPKFIFNQFRNT